MRRACVPMVGLMDPAHPTGFESSSNFVENQAPGVFPKTLRNMWVAVSTINPSIAILAQCLLPMHEIEAQAVKGESRLHAHRAPVHDRHRQASMPRHTRRVAGAQTHPDTPRHTPRVAGALLSEMGKVASGEWLRLLIVCDAMLVLIGATITAFVGYTGLVHRMAVDRCLPQALLRVNKLRRTRHWVINSFWAMTSLLVLVTWGQLETVAGVYTICFLSVMWSFSVGNMLLKLRRGELPPPPPLPHASSTHTRKTLTHLARPDPSGSLGFHSPHLHDYSHTRMSPPPRSDATNGGTRLVADSVGCLLRHLRWCRRQRRHAHRLAPLARALRRPLHPTRPGVHATSPAIPPAILPSSRPPSALH